MKAAVSLSIVCAVLFCSADAVRASWSLSGLNPFAKKDPPAATQKSTSKINTSSSVPQMSGKPIHPQPSQPSMLSKIGSAPGNMWSKTKQVLTPAAKPAANVKPASGSAPKPGASSDSGYSWNPFASKKSVPEQPHTTSEFIGLPRPSVSSDR